MIIFFIAYGGCLVSMLTFPQRDKAIDSFEDLAKSTKDLKIHVLKSSFQEYILSTATDGYFKTVWDKIVGNGKKIKHHEVLENHSGTKNNMHSRLKFRPP